MGCFTHFSHMKGVRATFSSKIPEKDVKEVFRIIGEIEEFKFTEKPKISEAMVVFKEEICARMALELSGVQFSDRKLYVNPATTTYEDSSNEIKPRTLHLAEISHFVQEDDIRELFAECGPMQNINIFQQSSELNHAEVQFEYQEGYEKALSIDNSSLKVRNET